MQKDELKEIKNDIHSIRICLEGIVSMLEDFHELMIVWPRNEQFKRFKKLMDNK